MHPLHPKLYLTPQIFVALSAFAAFPKPSTPNPKPYTGDVAWHLIEQHAAWRGASLALLTADLHHRAAYGFVQEVEAHAAWLACNMTCVYIYIYIHICTHDIYVCRHVYIYIYIYLYRGSIQRHMYICIHACMHAHMHTCIHACAYICTYI